MQKKKVDTEEVVERSEVEDNNNELKNIEIQEGTIKHKEPESIIVTVAAVAKLLNSNATQISIVVVLALSHILK